MKHEYGLAVTSTDLNEVSTIDSNISKIKIDKFYDDVINFTVQGHNEIAKVPFDEDDYRKSVGAT